MPSESSSGGTERFWIAGQGNGGTCETYHTDRNCPMLQRAESIHEWTSDGIRENREHCQVCAGTVEQGEQSRDHIRALKEAAE